MGYTDERILDGLIAKKVTLMEAQRLGLGASEPKSKTGSPRHQRSHWKVFAHGRFG